MKKIFFLLILIYCTNNLQAQTIKNLGKNLKKDAEWKLQRTIRDKVDDGVDSLSKLPKKSKQKKEEKRKQQAEEKTDSLTGTATSTKTSKKNTDKEGDGYITLDLSTPITNKGLPVTITGESIKHGKWTNVKLEIKDPGGNIENVTLPLTDSGKYKLKWEKFVDEGDYYITANASNDKAAVTKRLFVTDWAQPQDENEDLMNRTITTYKKLKARVDEVNPMLAPKDAVILNKKLDEVKEKLDALHKLLKSLSAAKKEIGNLYKQGKMPNSYIRQNLAQLNQLISSKAREVTYIDEMISRQTNDATICEYLAMIVEACAAFSVFTNLWATSVSELIINITLDKAVPKQVEMVHTAVGKPLSDNNEWTAKEGAKIYASSKVDEKNFRSKLGRAGIAGDLIQFVSEALIKDFCGVYKGEVLHTYNISYINEEGETWWTYRTKVKGAIILRYPKSQQGGIIKMKGNIEGNAIDFKFDADPRLNPEYLAGTRGKVVTQVLKNQTPLSLPFTASMNDFLGFGAVARAIATPACFNLVVDAEYDTQKDEIKLYITQALMDFTSLVYNRQFFIQWSAGLPFLRIMDYPITRVKLTMNANLKEKNSFEVKKDAKQVPFFTGTIEREIGAPVGPTYHELAITVTAKKD